MANLSSSPSPILATGDVSSAPRSIVIPKVFHRIWLGGKPMPEVFERWGRTWTDLHPGWEMRLWTEQSLPALKNGRYLEKCCCLAQRSDLVRYEILEQFGGVYIDTDLECFRNIEALIGGLDFFAAHKRVGRISNALIGGIKGHPIFRDLVDKWTENFSTDETAAMGPPYFAKILQAHAGAMLFGQRVFQAFSIGEYTSFPRLPITITQCPEGSYVVNHHSSQWFKPSTERLIP